MQNWPAQETAYGQDIESDAGSVQREESKGRRFPYGASNVAEPYATNGTSKFLIVLGIVLSPCYLGYIWNNRRPDMLGFATLFFIGELTNLILGLTYRFVTWHRQQRYVCRLDSLTPTFPQEQWPKVHLFFTHYAEPVTESAKPLLQALQQQYPVDRYVVNILDDGYHKRLKDDTWEVTSIGREMEALVEETLSQLAQAAGQPEEGRSVTREKRVITAEDVPCYRPEVAPGGSTVIEFSVPGLPLVRLIGRKKGKNSFMKTGNLENALWNVMEEDVQFMVVLDTDMAPEKELLQLLLPPMLECRDGRWQPDWKTAFTSSPQVFSNIEDIWGASDPMNQSNKYFWRIMPSALDASGLVHFWGTNVAFFVPALRDARGFVYNCMTEDTVTGAQIHRLGWSSAFVGDMTMTLAKGLCRETVTETFNQRKRWCQGNVQQLLMEWDPPFILHDDFRFPPYRRQFREHLRAVMDADRRGDASNPLAPEDTGAEFRRSRRSPIWKIRRELAYFNTKHAVLFHIQPVYYYFLTLATIYLGRPPFLVASQPIHSFADVFSNFHLLIAYWVVNAAANALTYSAVLDDPHNPNNTVWRTQQEYWGYAWIRLLGIFQGTWSAITGKQPTWNSFGMSSGVNLVYVLPNAIGFAVLATSMCFVFVNYMVAAKLGVAIQGLPVPPQHSLGELTGVLLAGFWVLVLLWPTTSCIFADLLGVPYYKVGAIVSTAVAATVQVGIAAAFFLASN